MLPANLISGIVLHCHALTLSPRPCITEISDTPLKVERGADLSRDQYLGTLH
jgi:hypothetical protein